MIGTLIYVGLASFSAAVFASASDWSEWAIVLGAFVWPISLPTFIGMVVGKLIKKRINQ